MAERSGGEGAEAGAAVEAPDPVAEREIVGEGDTVAEQLQSTIELHKAAVQAVVAQRKIVQQAGGKDEFAPPHARPLYDSDLELLQRRRTRSIGGTCRGSSRTCGIPQAGALEGTAQLRSAMRPALSLCTDCV